MQREADKLNGAMNLFSSAGLAKAQLRAKQPAMSAELALRIIGKVQTKARLIQVGDQLIELAEHAYGCRELDRLDELSHALLALPLPLQYKTAAKYFRGLEMIRRGYLNDAKTLLEVIASKPWHPYSARAILSLGVVFHRLGDFESALKLHFQAGRCSTNKHRPDLFTGVAVQRNLAVFKSMLGDHRGALSDLERMGTCAAAIRRTHPHIYYEYQNSLAVEYGELGRFAEAKRAAEVAVSSRFAIAYPEWLRTFDDLMARTPRALRSAVLIRRPPGDEQGTEVSNDVGEQKVFHLPLADRSEALTVPDQNQRARQARVLSFQQWKDSIKGSNACSPEPITPEQRRQLSTGQKLIRLMDLISQDETDDETIDSILEAVEKIILKRRTPTID